MNVATLSDKALAAIDELVDLDELDADIQLMDDSLDIVLGKGLPDTPEQRLDYAVAYRRMGNLLRRIRKHVVEGE